MLAECSIGFKVGCRVSSLRALQWASWLVITDVCNCRVIEVMPIVLGLCCSYCTRVARPTMVGI